MRSFSVSSLHLLSLHPLLQGFAWRKAVTFAQQKTLLVLDIYT